MFQLRRSPFARRRTACWLAVLVLVALGLPQTGHELSRITESVIVQGSGVESVRAAVERAGGEVTHELAIIRAVAADVTAAQRSRLEDTPGLRVYENSMAGALRIRSRDGLGVSWLPLTLVRPDLDSGLLTRAGGDTWAIRLDIRIHRLSARPNQLIRRIWAFLERREGDPLT